MTLNQDDVVRVAMTMVGPQASIAQNVWHYVMTGGAGAAEGDFTDAVETNVNSMFLEIDSFLSNTWEWTFLEFWVRDAVNQVWNGIGTEVLSGLVGLAADSPIPHGAAAVGTVITELQRRQGRTFLAGPQRDSVDEGLFDASFVVAFILYLAEFVADITPTGGTFEWCTYNTTPGSIYEETPSVFAGVLNFNNIVGYQRRRKPGVGL